MNKSGMQYYQHNSHGDVIGITDLAKNWLVHYGYDAFGEEILGYIDNTGNNFKYCGEYFDAESGSYYLRARYYQPSIGRFTTEDPHWNTGNMIYGDNPVKINERKNPYNPHNPEVFAYMPDISAVVQSGNLYGYGLNSPLMFVDPSGEFGVLAGIVAGVMILGGVLGLTSCGDSSIKDNSVIKKNDIN